MLRQIAGALARRIVWYTKEGDALKTGEEYGFIKFGSRVDVFLPIGTEICVNLNDKTTGGKTVIARLK
jgi:phosphatidylserine decarboxylase